MKKSKIIILASLISAVAIIVWLVITLFFSQLDYNQVLARSSNLMRQNGNISLIYNVTITGEYDRNFINETTQVFYLKNIDKVNWLNDLTIIKDTVYDLMPEDLAIMMMTNYSSNGQLISYDELHSCYLLDDRIEGKIPGNTLVKGYSYARIMACFNKTTGYPLYYGLLVSGSNNLIISYKLSDIL